LDEEFELKFLFERADEHGITESQTGGTEVAFQGRADASGGGDGTGSGDGGHGRVLFLAGGLARKQATKHEGEAFHGVCGIHTADPPDLTDFPLAGKGIRT
jgi:hypothetical protein